MSSACTCPTCGQAIEPAQICIDAERGLIVYRGADTKLTPQQMRLFGALWASYPRVATYETIIASLKGGADVSNAERLVWVMLNHMRPTLAEIGIVVETVKEVGYVLRLDVAGKSAREEQRARAAGFRVGVPLPKSTLDRIAELRARHYPASDIARRTGMTYRAVTAALEAMKTDEVAA